MSSNSHVLLKTTTKTKGTEMPMETETGLKTKQLVKIGIYKMVLTL